MMRARNLLLVLLFGLFVLDLNMESTHGIKCYYCSNPCWQKPETQKEKECDPNPPNSFDRCITIIKPEGVTARACRSSATEADEAAKGVRCDAFGERGEKHCYCDTDLCNGVDNATMRSTTRAGAGANGAEILGHSQCQLLLGVLASVVLSVASWIRNRRW